MLKNRALTTVLIAAMACAAQSGTAHAARVPAAPRPAPDSSRPMSVPASGLSGLAKLTRKANPRSTNWAGYAVTGGGYTSVASNWVEPDVTCTSTGIVGFWIGLDGWGSTSVEQDGTGVDCSDGTPQQFAWWETYPENSIQVYQDPVTAGDRMSSEVASEGNGQYVMVLTDWTRNWSERNAVSAPTAQNASAEIVAEAVSSGQGITPLPDFGAIGFTGSTINGGSVQAAAAKAIDMTDTSNNLIATTTSADQDGDFTVDYVGPTAVSTDSATGSGSAARAGGRTSGREPLVSRLESVLARL